MFASSVSPHLSLVCIEVAVISNTRFQQHWRCFTAMCAWDTQFSNLPFIWCGFLSFCFYFSLCFVCLCARPSSSHSSFFFFFCRHCCIPVLHGCFLKMVHIIKLKSIRNTNICHIVLLTCARDWSARRKVCGHFHRRRVFRFVIVNCCTNCQLSGDGAQANVCVCAWMDVLKSTTCRTQLSDVACYFCSIRHRQVGKQQEARRTTGRDEAEKTEWKKQFDVLHAVAQREVSVCRADGDEPSSNEMKQNVIVVTSRIHFHYIYNETKMSCDVEVIKNKQIIICLDVCKHAPPCGCGGG